MPRPVLWVALLWLLLLLARTKLQLSGAAIMGWSASGSSSAMVQLIELVQGLVRMMAVAVARLALHREPGS